MEKRKVVYKEPVRLREKTLKDGNVSLYLDCYHNGKRWYEFLRLYLVPEFTAVDKDRNKATLKLAESRKMERILALNKGDFSSVMPSKEMLSHLIDVHANSERMVKSAKNIHRVHDLVMQYGDRKVIQVDRRYLLGFIKFLGTVVTKGKHMKENSKSQYLTILSSVLNNAVADGLIQANPMRSLRAIEKPHPGQAHREYLTLDEVSLLANTPCKHDVEKRAFLFACFCGLRYSDIRQLRWCNIITRPNGVKVARIRMQKTGELLDIELSENALAWMPTRQSTDKDTDIVFVGLMEHSSYANHVLNKWTADAGITKHISFHCSRHTCATLLLTYGADLYTVSKILGHTNISTTQIYAKIVDAKREEAVSMIPKI